MKPGSKVLNFEQNPELAENIVVSPEDVLVVRHLSHHHHNVGDPVLDFGSDLSKKEYYKDPWSESSPGLRSWVHSLTSMMPPSLVMSCWGGTLKAESLTTALMHLENDYIDHFSVRVFCLVVFAMSEQCFIARLPGWSQGCSLSPVKPGENKNSAGTLCSCE